MMSEKKIATIDDLRAIMDSLAQKRYAKGVSCQEIKSQTGWHVRKVREFIRKAMEDGLCRFAGKRQIQDIGGRMVSIPVYQFGR